MIMSFDFLTFACLSCSIAVETSLAKLTLCRCWIVCAVNTISISKAFIAVIIACTWIANSTNRVVWTLAHARNSITNLVWTFAVTSWKTKQIENNISFSWKLLLSRNVMLLSLFFFLRFLRYLGNYSSFCGPLILSYLSYWGKWQKTPKASSIICKGDSKSVSFQSKYGILSKL